MWVSFTAFESIVRFLSNRNNLSSPALAADWTQMAAAACSNDSSPSSKGFSWNMVAPALCNCDILALFDVHENEWIGLQCMCWLNVVYMSCSSVCWQWCIEGPVFGVRSSLEEIFCLCGRVYILTGSGTLSGLSDGCAGPAWWLWSVFAVGPAPSKIIQTCLFLAEKVRVSHFCFSGLACHAGEVSVLTLWLKF